MKIGFFADLHAKVSTPRCRNDDYEKTIKEKFYQIIDITNAEGCDILVEAGDFFDDHKQPYHLTNWFIETIRACWSCSKLYGIAGQHDMVNHTLKMENTPFKTLINSDCVFPLGSAPVAHPPSSENDKTVHIYGQSWGEKTPEIRNPEFFNVLVIHETLVQSKIWEGQKEPKYAIDFLKKHKFDLIIGGDNHKPFVENYRGRTLVMAGSVARLSSDQINHNPSVWVYDTTHRDLKRIELKINPNVISKEEKKEKRTYSNSIQEFANSLERGVIHRNFVSRALEGSKEIKNKAVRNEISDILAAVTER